MKNQTIIFASSNVGKLREVKAMLEAEKIEIKYLKDFSQVSEPIEDGKTFLENAIIKAKYYYEQFKLPVLCDDSGLVVEALNGEPGVYSARYASATTNQDAENINKLLAKMEGITNRSAYFNCTMVYYDGKNLFQTTGKIVGMIIAEQKGSNGFGYDPVFVPMGYDVTLAELSEMEKNKISHRHEALFKMRELLEKQHIIE